ncbi:MAG: branched-chain amino acid ABC transporter permease [Dehalococcoidia bacterium]
MTLFLQLLIQGLMVGAVYALVALGFVLIYKSSRVLNLAQGEFMLVGAYICWQFWTSLGVVGFPLWLAFPATFVVVFFMGLLVERMLLRPMIGQPVVGVIMMTIGLLFFLRGVSTLIWGGPALTYVPPILPSAGLQLGPINLSLEYIWAFGITAALFGGFTLFFKYTRMGLAMRATGEDEQAAQSVGISPRQVYAASWAIAAVVATVGGIVIGSMVSISNFMSDVGLAVMAVPLVGGLESVLGVMIAGPIIGVAENLSVYVDWTHGGAKEVAPFVIMVIILLIRPYGLFGLKRIERI